MIFWLIINIIIYFFKPRLVKPQKAGSAYRLHYKFSSVRHLQTNLLVGYFLQKISATPSFQIYKAVLEFYNNLWWLGTSSVVVPPRPARLHRLAESNPWNRFLGSLKSLKIPSQQQWSHTMKKRCFLLAENQLSYRDNVFHHVYDFRRGNPIRRSSFLKICILLVWFSIIFLLWPLQYFLLANSLGNFK